MSDQRDGTHIPNPETSLSGHGARNTEVRLPDQDANAYPVNTAVPASTAQSASPPHRIRRRNRMITSCLECRRRKLKCDKLHPCTNCSKFVRDCVFLAPALDSASQLKLSEIKERMGVLERGLEVEFANAKKQQRRRQNGESVSMKNGASLANSQQVRKGSSDLPGEPTHEDSEEDGAASFPEDEKGLEPTPLAVVDAAYDDDADDDMLDLGVKMGKMRMTERLGGYFRPKMTEEISFTLNSSGADGPSSEHDGNSVLPVSPLSPPHSQKTQTDKESFLEPGPTYIAPGSGFIFGNVSSQPSIIDFLPSRLAGDRLIQQYHDSVHFIARVVHWPTFKTQYDNFWANVTAGIEPQGSLQAIVFAVMFSAVVSMNENDVTTLFSVSKRNLMASFQTATEVGLGKANFLRTTKLETLQALVILLIPMCRNEMSRAHSVLVGTAIRLAECMGLHRDPQTTYGLGPLESHTRRILWCQLCFLDIRTAEAQGPRPLLRRDDFDSSFPLNVNDADLVSGNPGESSGWTDMTFSKIRFECNEMHRVIWVDRSRLEKKQISLTHVLGKIESFRKAMEEKYHPILNENVPLQKEAKLVMNLLLLRMHIMVLHRYANSFWVRIPDRIRQIILTTGTQQMEDAVQLEIEPMLQQWAWYCGAYQQWHTAFLLLVEIFSFPMRREADRIWRIVDYVFETDSSMTREQKGRSILSGLRDRTGAYRDVRKMRAPINMMSRLYANPAPGQKDGRGTTLPPNFNSDPTPPASRAFRDSSTARHPSYTSAEYPNTTSNGSRSLSQTSSNHSQQTQPCREARSDSSYSRAATVPATADASPPTPANLGQMTRALADAPSPSSTTDSYRDLSWTFDAPTTYFLPQSRTSKSGQTTLPGERSSRTSPPTSDPTSSPDNYPNSSLMIAGRQIPATAGLWGSGTTEGEDMVYSMSLPQGLIAGGSLKNAALPVNSGGAGDAIGSIEKRDVNQRTSPQAGKGSGLETDAVMVDIDWTEWDKIFPPEVNTGILNEPVQTNQQQF